MNKGRLLTSGLTSPKRSVSHQTLFTLKVNIMNKQELFIWFYTARAQESKLFPLYEDYWLSDKYCPKKQVPILGDWVMYYPPKDGYPTYDTRFAMPEILYSHHLIGFHKIIT